MNQFKLFLSSTISLIAFLSISPSSYASYTCSDGIFGMSCRGSIDGQSVNTTTTDGIFGSRTTGTIGGERIDITCSDGIFGTTCR